MWGLPIALLFCLVFLRGRSIHLLGRVGQRAAVSAAGGAAVAYVFMDLSPELHEAAAGFREATSHLAMRALRYGIHIAVMSGFLLFYGLDEMVFAQGGEAQAPAAAFRFHLLVFAVYAGLVSCLLVRRLDAGALSLTLYAGAMSLHFLALGHTLREKHGEAYDRLGAPLLAAFSLAGWVIGVAVDLPAPALGVLLGLVAGGVIANTMISEIPRENEGKFTPFLLGATGYSILLLAAG